MPHNTSGDYSSVSLSQLSPQEPGHRLVALLSEAADKEHSRQKFNICIFLLVQWLRLVVIVKNGINNILDKPVKRVNNADFTLQKIIRSIMKGPKIKKTQKYGLLHKS